jgi:hypothetical protein
MQLRSEGAIRNLAYHPNALSGETTMTRNIVALAAALGVSGLFFAAVLA